MLGGGGQEAHQSQLPSPPPARDEPVCRGRESKDNQLQVGKFDVPRDLKLGRAKARSDVQVVFRVDESSGIGRGVEQPLQERNEQQGERNEHKAQNRHGKDRMNKDETSRSQEEPAAIRTLIERENIAPPATMEAEGHLSEQGQPGPKKETMDSLGAKQGKKTKADHGLG